jgi:uncharacterized membrane-anchored protein YitT (DUF2179 family)
MSELKKTVDKKNKTERIILLFISLLISASLYSILLLPLSLVTGGTSGIATITYYLYYIDPAIMILLLSIACVIFGYMYLGKERTNTTLIATIIFPILVEITHHLFSFIKIDTNDTLLLVLFAGVISGVANGLMYKTGYNSGGIQMISQILYEQFKISIAKTNLVINLIIVLTGSFFFGLTNALYAIIYLYINSIVMDKVLLGISNNKAFYIITDCENEVKNYIIDVLKHTVTIFDVKGGFLEGKRRVILTVIPSREYYRVTEGIKKIDKSAFFVVTDAYQVEGAK